MATQLLKKLSSTLTSKNSNDKSIAELKESVENKPNDSNALAKLGNLLLKEGNKEEAITYLKQAVTLEPTHYKILETYGMALSKDGKSDEVKMLFERAIKKKPKDQNLLESYFRVLTKLKEYDAAYEIAKRLQENSSQDKSVFGFKKPLTLFSKKSENNSLDVSLTPELFWEVGNYLLKHPKDLLKIPVIRSRLSRFRRQQMYKKGDLSTMDITDNMVTQVVDHNVKQLDSCTDDGTRPELLIYPLVAIDYVASHLSEMKVLTIGPRSEAEIFALIAAGFRPENISGVDLISYTPFIDQGDMHALPYDDASFDIVIAGWVLTYSKNNQQAANEILRVCNPNAYIAVGCAYDIPEKSSEKENTRYSTPEDIIQYFDHKIAHVIFRGHVERERLQGDATVSVIMQKESK